MTEASATVEFGKECHIPEMRLAILVEKSRSGEKTTVHLRKISAVTARRLTKESRKG